MIHGSFFSGIGGFDLAAEWMGWENAFHCEKNTFGQEVLKYYWPKAKLYEDIKETDFRGWKGKIDVLTGGFPCQPYSVAGLQHGDSDPRHLWPEYLRGIREIQPPWVVPENVRGLINWNAGLVFDKIQTDLETEGYEVVPFLLPACSVNAPHKRERIFFIAYSKCYDDIRKKSRRFAKQIEVPQQHRKKYDQPGQSGGTNEIDYERRYAVGYAGTPSDAAGIGQRKQANEINPIPEDGEAWTEFGGISGGGIIANAGNKQLQGRMHPGRSETTERYLGALNACGHERTSWEDFPSEPPLCFEHDGLPGNLDRITISKWRVESLKAAGNAVVPELIIPIFKAIEIYSKI